MFKHPHTIEKCVNEFPFVVYFPQTYFDRSLGIGLSG